MFRRPGADIGITSQHLHLQATGPDGEPAADPAEADETERAAGQPVHRAKLGKAGPAATLDGPVAGRDPPRAGEQQGKRVLGIHAELGGPAWSRKPV